MYMCCCLVPFDIRKPKMAISCFKRFQAQFWGLPGDRQNYQKSNHCVAAFFADSEQGIVRPSVYERNITAGLAKCHGDCAELNDFKLGPPSFSHKVQVVASLPNPPILVVLGVTKPYKCFLIAHQGTDWLKFGTQWLEQCSYGPQACGWNQPWRQHVGGFNTHWDHTIQTQFGMPNSLLGEYPTKAPVKSHNSYKSLVI